MPEVELSVAQYYHERTKYHPETLARQAQPIDWDAQPSPYKDYKFGLSLDLKPSALDTLDEPAANWWRRLSKLLYCTYGITARLPQMGMVLRSAPSAGGLYPAEVYVVSRGNDRLGVGLYHYQVKTHSLLQVWDDPIWPALQEACFEHPTLAQATLAVITTAVFQRSVWRYGDRAYRRIYLDTGHLLGNLALASTLAEYTAIPIGGFDDDRLERLLFLEPDREGVTAVVALSDRTALATEGGIATTPDSKDDHPNIARALPSPVDRTYPDLPDGALLSYLHRATRITGQDGPIMPPWLVQEPPLSTDKYNLPFGLKLPLTHHPIDWGDRLQTLERTILHRRSTRAYSGDSLSSDELSSILGFAYQPQQYADQGLDSRPALFDPYLINTFVAVSDVRGLETGCYYYAPHSNELRQIRFKNFRNELHFLCLGQELGRDAAAVVFQTADLAAAIERYGDRAYRYLHLDSGHYGQRLNLAAISLGLGASGIAGFFDDQVNDVLGIPNTEAVLYITTLGQTRRRS
ncbi:MAG: SagB/ThcOx family dehydrogenase [Oscillatoriales cyanobacterium]|nr:MAG: SagB/ThcOx family dehydrogenase [Oscillatoriales cyanobacterium]